MRYAYEICASRAGVECSLLPSWMGRQQEDMSATPGPWQDPLLGVCTQGTRVTHYDGELAGIALALEGHDDTLMLEILSDSKPALRAIERLDRGRTEVVH